MGYYPLCLSEQIAVVYDIRLVLQVLQIELAVVNQLTLSSTQTLLYIIGLILSVIAVIDIVKKPISTIGKIICSVLVLITSWVGLVVYYLYAKNHLTEWFK